MKLDPKAILDRASRVRLLVFACLLALVADGLMVWSLFDQGWIPVMMAMSVGQAVGTLSFGLFLLVVLIDLRRATFRSPIPGYPAAEQQESSTDSEKP